MARTYLSGDNSRGGQVTGAGATYAHLRGWNAGVQVSAYRTDDDRDGFTVSLTAGSNGSGASTFLGTVDDTPDGPVWTPAGQVYTRAQLRSGTGFPRGARFVMLPPDPRR